MIYAGEVKDIRWSSGTWLILDIGFSNKSRSCGFLLGDYKPTRYRFSEAVSKVIEAAQTNKVLNLVIEAPLSVAFNRHRNPKGRSVEKKGSKTRYWYFGPGCTVLVATTYLMQKLVKSKPAGTIRLFEGFVSYKDRGKPTDHLLDVKLLKEAIMAPNASKYCKKPQELKLDDDDILESAFKAAGMDFGIPPVISIQG